jgi:hypothetical protein
VLVVAGVGQALLQMLQRHLQLEEHRVAQVVAILMSMDRQDYPVLVF